MKKNNAFHLVTLAAISLATGCPDTKPAKIEFQAPPAAIFTQDFFNLGARVVNAAGEAIPESPVAYSAVPAGVLRISAAGEASCEASGDVSVTLAGAGLSSVATVSCRLVKELKAKKSTSLVIGNDPLDLGIEAFGPDQKRMENVPYQISVSDPGIASVDAQGKATGLSVGATSVKVTAGNASATVELEVMDKVKSSPLAIGDGGTSTIVLEQGKYLVEVQADAGSGHGVSLSWVGAACERQPERQSHKAKCVVENTASLTIENPSLLGFGGSATGFVNIYRVH